MREYEAARQEVERKNLALSRAQQELDTLADQISAQEQAVASARRVYDDQTAALEAEIATDGDVARLTEKINQAKRWKELRQEQELLTEQQQTTTQGLSRVRQTLTTLLQQEATAEQTLRDLIQQRERIREEENEKARLALEADHLGKDLREANEGGDVQTEGIQRRIGWSLLVAALCMVLGFASVALIAMYRIQ